MVGARDGAIEGDRIHVFSFSWRSLVRGCGRSSIVNEDTRIAIGVPVRNEFPDSMVIGEPVDPSPYNIAKRILR